MSFAGYVRALGLGVLVLGIGGCTGEINGIRDENGNVWNPGEFTYEDMARSTQQNAQGNHIIEPDKNSVGKVTPDQIHTPITLLEQLKIVTVSREHTGDLDYVAKALRNKRGDFIVTLEVPNGPVLTTVSLADHELLKGNQLKKKNRHHTSNQGLGIEVPGSLAGPDTSFPVALFACIDTNHNGQCADEIVNHLDEPKPAQDVIFFAALKGVVQGEGDSRTVAFAHATPSELSPDWIMGEVLNNLPSQVGEQPLTLSLAVQALGANVPGLAQTGEDVTPQELWLIRKIQTQKPKHKKRTNGCFVRGTRIILGSGEVIRVEQIFTGTTMTTADGIRRTVEESVAGAERLPIIAIQTEQGQRLRVTQGHPMLTPTGLRMAAQLKVGDRLVAADRSVVAITSLRRLPYGDLVFNFTLPGSSEADHLVNAEGLITGDLHLQRRLAAIE